MIKVKCKNGRFTKYLYRKGYIEITYDLRNTLLAGLAIGERKSLASLLGFTLIIDHTQ